MSRLLVRLQPKMEAKSLWRTGLYLESPLTGTKKMKVLILARLEVNELEVSVRGAEVSVAHIILEIVGNEISEVSKNYAGLTVSHEDSGENNGEDLEDGSKSSQKQKWWEFENKDQSSAWETRNLGPSSIKILPVVEDGLPVTP